MRRIGLTSSYYCQNTPQLSIHHTKPILDSPNLGQRPYLPRNWCLAQADDCFSIVKASFIFRNDLVLCLGVFASIALTTASSIGPCLKEQGDDFSFLATSEQLSPYRNPCLDESAQEFCCLEYGVGCTDDIVPKESCSSEKLQPGQFAYCCSKHGISCPRLGETCSEIFPCEEGTCVFSQLFFARTGKCESIIDGVVKCSVEYCSLHGADSACTVGDLDTDVLTCGAWHRYLIMGGANICFFPCTKECLSRPLRPVTSDGRVFCTLCQLKGVSCNSGFSVYGPIESDEPEPSTEPETDAAENGRDQSSTKSEMESPTELLLRISRTSPTRPNIWTRPVPHL